jgi:hypothetical protein
MLWDWCYICILTIVSNSNGDMQTVTIDIINDKAIKLLQDLELLQLIRMRKDKEPSAKKYNPTTRYKGAMTKQPLTDIEDQFNELRNGWE